MSTPLPPPSRSPNAQAQTPGQTQPAPPGMSWWRVPHMWLVVGGPLVVVIASVGTAFLAVRGADPVIDKNAYEQQRASAHLRGTQAVPLHTLMQLEPAQQARNHAAAPAAPFEK